LSVNHRIDDTASLFSTGYVHLPFSTSNIIKRPLHYQHTAAIGVYNDGNDVFEKREREICRPYDDVYVTYTQYPRRWAAASLTPYE
jgi:hypothetical protein